MSKDRNEQPEITFIARTDADVDNGRIERKVVETETDDYGNEYTVCRKEVVDVGALAVERAAAAARIEEIDWLLAAVDAAR